MKKIPKKLYIYIILIFFIFILVAISKTNAWFNWQSAGDPRFEVKIGKLNSIKIKSGCFEFQPATKTITKYFDYEEDNNSKPVCPKEVVIPSKINGIDVETIADGTSKEAVFFNKNITSVVFPNTLKKIGDYALSKNKLSGILTIPKNVVSIGNYTFLGSGTTNQLTSVLFENDSSLQTIGKGAFANNKLSDVITIPKNVTLIDDNAFYGNSNGSTNQLTSVLFESNSSLQTIGNSAFANNKLSGSLTIPKSVTTINSNAFWGNTDGTTNQLTSVLFESNSSLQTIGVSAFSRNKLSGTIIIPKSVTLIDDFAFVGSNATNKIESVVFEPGSSLKAIGSSAFANNKLSGTITIPKSVTTINSNAFWGNTDGTTNQLTSVLFEGGSMLQTIGEGAFANNKLSGSLTIPKSVITIEKNAFVGSSDGSTNQLTSVLFESGSSLQTIGASAFSRNKLSGTIRIPKSVTLIDDFAFIGSNTTNKIASVVFEPDSSLQTIGVGAFSSNKIVGSLTIPRNVTIIKKNAFYGGDMTDQLESLLFESGSVLKTIESSAFAYNKLGGTITIPKSVTSIGDNAFVGNETSNQLKNLVFEPGSSLQTIGNYAFANNKLVGVLTIPKSVTSIGNNAFNGSSTTNQLESLLFEPGSSLQTIGDGSFANNKLVGVLTIPKSVTSIGAFAFVGSSNSNIATNEITGLLFESGSMLQTIRNYAFLYNKINTVTIPSNVTSIGVKAFYQENTLLTKVINTTGRSFLWCNDPNGIIETVNCSPKSDFITGNITINLIYARTVQITSS